MLHRVLVDLITSIFKGDRVFFVAKRSVEYCDEIHSLRLRSGATVYFFMVLYQSLDFI